MSTPIFSSAQPPLTPKLDISSGLRKSHFFQPPPSSACSSLQNSTVSLQSSSTGPERHQSKKRARVEEKPVFRARRSSALHTPPPLIAPRHKLPPNTHSLQSLQCLGQSGADSNPPMTPPAYHSEKCGERTGIAWGIEDESEENASALLDDHPNSPGIRDGLGNVIFRFAGVAGKVWRDWSTSFRGFCAGAGQSYELKEPIIVDGENERWQVIRSDEGRLDIESVPGGFPEDDYIPNYMSQDHTKTPVRAPKRSRHESGMSEKWVKVESSTIGDVNSARLSRKNTPASTSTKRAARRSKRIMPPVSTCSPTGPGRTSPHRASYAPMRTPTRSTGTRDSPVSLEVRQHAARIRRQDAEEEANLKRLNAQLKAMIKEGKEALGTKFEVEDDSNEENMEPDIFE